MPDRVIDDNLVLQQGADRKDRYVCRHCGTVIADAGSSWRVEHTTVSIGLPGTAGPHLNDDFRTYLDVDVVLRQGYCPGCFTALFTETVPVETEEAPMKGPAL